MKITIGLIWKMKPIDFIMKSINHIENSDEIVNNI